MTEEWHGDVDLIRWGLADGTYVEQRLTSGVHVVRRARFNEHDRLTGYEVVLSIYPDAVGSDGARAAFAAWLRATADILEQP